MGSQRRLLFDLNELPVDDNGEEESECIDLVQQCEALPSNSNLTEALPCSASERTSSFFSHEPSSSGFQPFVRPMTHLSTDESSEANLATDRSSTPPDKTGNEIERKAHQLVIPASARVQDTETEEGEWLCTEATASPFEVTAGTLTSNNCEGTNDDCKSSNGKNTIGDGDRQLTVCANESESDHAEGETVSDQSNPVDVTWRNSKSNAPNGGYGSVGEVSIVQKPKETKGVEGIHPSRSVNNPAKRLSVDHCKEAMLGKKRTRQTVFLNLEDVKQVSSMKTPTRRQNSLPSASRTVREVRNAPCFTESKPEKKSLLSNGVTHIETALPSLPNGNTECTGECSKQDGLTADDAHQPDDQQADAVRQPPSNWAMKRNSSQSIQKSVDSKLVNKKLKKTGTVGPPQGNDTSVERLIREVTGDRFWQRTENSGDLQSIPGRFESVGQYVGVFEPLLFEECQAQLYNTWEELTETGPRDAHVLVRVKSVERRERGWYDAVVLPARECKWMFKEGDVAVLSCPRPGSGLQTARSRNNSGNSVTGEDGGQELTGRVAGTVRRYFPVDPRDQQGAIVHFYVGDSYDAGSSKVGHILNKLRPKGMWYLTVLGPLATTQREYVALHAFRRLGSQMQTAILHPSPDHFPKYEDQAPSMPDCFTPNFIDYLHRTFNGPQLAAIQWAAMHTAAGVVGTGKRQDPWPFTLVQGPPGTGKTHTVSGMLNVIHLVQYQHYYTALLKKLAPDSYKQAADAASLIGTPGSIDEVLQHMDQNLFRTLPKLCPKPRMLVCAPSNAATDELLSRVLDRGFIDGEMKVYRPDIARVGVDSQTRAAQAVSVERRTEQLLVMGREEVIGWMHQLRAREAQFSQQISSVQRELNAAAAAVRMHGSVGVDPEVLVARDQSRDAFLQNLAAAVEGRDKVLVELSRLIILENRFRGGGGGGFNMEEARASLEASFANEAEIVFTTVSSSGRKLFSRLTHGFDMVVVDEAAQASEVAVLPPLSLGAARCVLVGDPQQLPATVISKAAGTLMYSRSLFERFQQAGCPAMLLSVQYRMHPQIRDFPSRYFYQGRLADSDTLAGLADEAYHKDPLLRPYLFYDVTHGRESQCGGSVSYQNMHEAQLCLRLYEHLMRVVKVNGTGQVSVGLITPYKLQLKCLQREFDQVLNSEDGRDLYINTVDAFQGQERDVIIMSCVRASGHGVGFVSDVRRMNVALTRARRALWVMGNAGALMQCEDWAALINDARARRCFVDMESLPMDFLASKPPPPLLPYAQTVSARGPPPMAVNMRSHRGKP